jgi:TrmH family RNA methyltransferase
VDRDAASAADLAALDGLDIEPVDIAGTLLERISTTASPQPVLGVARSWSTALEDLPADVGRALVLVDVADPGNAGTLLRCAEGSGVGSVVFAGECVEPFNPKVVRASAGSIFRCPLAVDRDVESVLADLVRRGLQVIGTDTDRGSPHFEADLAGPVALVLGNESHGLPTEVAELVDAWVHIPIEGSAESLNVAMAGTVLCFEALRQQSMGIAAQNASSLSHP